MTNLMAGFLCVEESLIIALAWRKLERSFSHTSMGVDSGQFGISVWRADSTLTRNSLHCSMVILRCILYFGSKISCICRPVTDIIF